MKRTLVKGMIFMIAVLIFPLHAFALIEPGKPTMEDLILSYEENLERCKQDPSEQLVHILPDDNEITIDEAFSLASQALHERAGQWYEKYTFEDVKACMVSGVMYCDYHDGNAPRYSFTFSQDIRDIRSIWTDDEQELQKPFRSFRVDVLNHGGAVTVSYDDPYSMRNLCMFARIYHSDSEGSPIPSAFWSLEDKEKLYRQLMEVYPREMARWQSIPAGYIADQWLSHVHSVPTPEELQPNEAIEQAKENLISQGVDSKRLDQCQIGVWFYRDQSQGAMYDIWFCDEFGKIVCNTTLNAYEK